MMKTWRLVFCVSLLFAGGVAKGEGGESVNSSLTKATVTSDPSATGEASGQSTKTTTEEGVERSTASISYLNRSSDEIPVVPADSIGVFRPENLANGVVTGTMRDRVTGELINGSIVVIRGTQKAAVLQKDAFSLAVDEQCFGRILECSCLGFYDQYVELKPGYHYDFVLEEDTTPMKDNRMRCYGSRRDAAPKKSVADSTKTATWRQVK